MTRTVIPANSDRTVATLFYFRQSACAGRDGRRTACFRSNALLPSDRTGLSLTTPWVQSCTQDGSLDHAGAVLKVRTKHGDQELRRPV